MAAEFQGFPDALPPSGHWVYQWPCDLQQPSVVLFLSVEENERRRRLAERVTGSDAGKTMEESRMEKDTNYRNRFVTKGLTNHGLNHCTCEDIHDQTRGGRYSPT